VIELLDSNADAKVFRVKLAAWFALVSLYAFVTLRFYRMFVFEQGSQPIYAVSDDVYVTACFGRSLFTGHGALWHPGALRVEGYTSPLWMVIVGAFHLLPGFEERALGLWIIAANLALLCAVLWVMLSIVDGARREAGQPGARLWLALPVMLGGGALCYWAAEGFEVVLVALFALLAFRLAAFQPITRRNALAIGLLLGIGFWTRIDSLVYASGAGVLLCARALAQRRTRELALAVAAVFALVGLQFALRYAYYGELLPNTFYLKTAYWPLRDRIALALPRDASLFPVAILAWVPLAIPALRRALGRQSIIVAACLLVFGLSVAYSVHNGGDAWKLQAGHDRYTVIGAVFLLLGLSIATVALRVRAAWLPLVVLLCTAAALDPVVRQNGSLERHAQRLLAARPPLRELERSWIEYGKRFEEISKLGARIAVCPAGAIVYFSHRGGVDLLGKIDPFVARLPATETRPPSGRCWQHNPGHNKENDAGSFKLRNPDFSRYRPPQDFEPMYRELAHQGARFYVRRNTPFLREEFIER
jgi:hypothetical protein